MPRLLLRVTLISTIALLLASCGTLHAQENPTLAAQAKPLTRNEQMMKEVWDEYRKAEKSRDKSAYESVIVKADIFLNDYGPKAGDMQQQLIDKGVQPHEGGDLIKPGHEKEKEAVLE